MPRAHRHPVEPEYIGPPMRLHKLLARAGKGSRRACEGLIAEGRVRVDGEVVGSVGASVDPSTAIVDVDGEAVHIERSVYYLLHKPQGYICSNDDDLGRNDRLAIDLLPPHDQRLYTVGRLDKDSEGLIVVTNDGDFTNKITHPRYQIPKTYRAVVRDTLSPADVERLQSGVWLAEGKTQPAQIRIVKNPRRGKSCAVEVTLREGKNREVRRVFARLGHPVSKLTRVAIGPIGIGDMKPGESRKLEPIELDALLMSGSPAPKPRRKQKVAVRTLAGDKPGQPGKRAPTTKSTPRRKPSRKPASRKPASRKSESSQESRATDAPRSRKPPRNKQAMRGPRQDGDERERSGGPGRSTGSAKKRAGATHAKGRRHQDGGRADDRPARGAAGRPMSKTTSKAGRGAAQGAARSEPRGPKRPQLKARTRSTTARGGSGGGGGPPARAKRTTREGAPRRRPDDEYVG